MAAVAALEAQRAVLGDATVDALLQPARAHLAALQAGSRDAAAPAQAQAQALRQVSILFLDVVGSTALSQQLDPEETSAVLDRALRRATATVEAHGGRVLQYAGDSLLAAFGADAAREDDAERAVLCGLALCALGREIGDEVEATFRRSGFDVRVGVHTGDVLLGGGVNDEGTIRGSNVNVAARMEQTAPVGRLRISHDTWSLVRGAFDVEAQEPLPVKGLAAPVRSYLVQSARPRATAADRRGVEGVTTPMVGRETELEVLQNAWRRVGEVGELVAISVVAEPGIGKSRLLAEFTHWLDARPERASVLQGSALPQTQAEAYGLLRDIVTRHLRIADDDSPEAGRDRIEQALTTLFDGDAGQAEANAHLLGHLIGFDWQHSPHLQGILHDPQQIRGRAFHAAAQMFRRLAVQDGRPVVLLLEDLHWADDPSLDFLADLVEVDGDVPLLMVASMRPTLAERRRDWASERPPRLRVELLPLDKRASRDLAHALLQRLPQVPDVLRDLVTGSAEGNPFYMEELVRMLIDQGAVVVGAEAHDPWQLHADRLVATRVPATLTGVLQSRLDELSPAEKGGLQQASIVGQVFWNDALVALDPQAPEYLPGLLQRGLLVAQADPALGQAGGYAFKHALLHQVVYGTVLKKERRDGHGRLARWLTAQAEEGRLRADDVLAMTAQHFELAGEALDAAQCHAGAAERATERYAHAVVLEHASRALPLLDGLAGRVEAAPALAHCRWRLLLARSQTFALLGRRPEQRADVEALAAMAEAADDDRWRAEAAGRQATLSILVDDWQAAEAQARRSLQFAREAGHDDVRLNATATLAMAARDADRLDEALALAERALSEARALGLQRQAYRLLRTLALIHESMGDELRSGEMELEALQVARATGDRAGQALGLVCEGLIAYYFGDLAQAQLSLEQGLELQRELGLRQNEAHTLTHVAAVTLDRGDAFRALALAQKSATLARSMELRGTEALALFATGEAALALGRSAEAASGFAAALAAASALSTGLQLGARAGLARARLAAGELEQALEQIEPILSHAWAEERLNYNHAPELVALTCHDVLAAANDPRAEEWLARAHQWMLTLAANIPDDARRKAHLQAAPHRRRIAALQAGRRA